MKYLFWELRLLQCSRSFVVLLAIYTAAALLTIATGKYAYQHSLEQHSRVEAHYQTELDQWRARGEVLDAGYLGYYQFVPTAPVISPWAALFNGEGPDHNWNLRVRLLALYGQIYASEIQHYDNTVLGAFDLAFIWIYLLPIAIGLLCVNILADEKNSGRWPLLRAQVKSVAHFLSARLTIYFLLLTLLNGSILLVAATVLNTAIDQRCLAIFGLLVIYQFFWFSVAGIIAHAGKNAGFNVLSYCGLWLFAAFLLPGLHYLKQMNSEELNTGVAILLEQREQMNDSWDRDKDKDFAQFLQNNPRWQDTSPLPGDFHWKWYYAMRTMSDTAVMDQAEKLRKLRLDAYQSAAFWAWFSPVMSFQRSLHSAAGTHGPAHQEYLDKVTQYHSSLKDFYYPHYFFEEPFPREKLDDIPRMQHVVSTEVDVLGVVQVLTACAAALLLLTFGAKPGPAHRTSSVLSYEATDLCSVKIPPATTPKSAVKPMSTTPQSFAER